jgi:aspartyl-tRNA(Asn)/glutamyl-tRNA(Gln) amidotransferase subunit B
VGAEEHELVHVHPPRIEAAIREQVAAYERGGRSSSRPTTTRTPTGSRCTGRREADDYRYFPEPDLVPIEPPVELVERLRAEVPALPGARIRRLEQAVGFDVAYALVTTERDVLFADLVADGVEPRLAANWVMNEFAATGDDPADVNVSEMATVLKTPNLTRSARSWTRPPRARGKGSARRPTRRRPR